MVGADANLHDPEHQQIRTRAWALFFVGATAALPFLSLHTSVVGEADSSRIIAAAMYVREHGPRFLIETQDVLLPHALLGPLLAWGGITLANAFIVGTLVVLSGTICYLAFRITNNFAGAVGASLSLLSIDAVVREALSLRMYLTMLTLAYLGLWFAYRSLAASGRKRWGLAIAAGILIVLAAEAHGVGQIFFAAPALLLLLLPTREGLIATTRLYLCMAVAYVPRALINLADGGLAFFRSNRVDYFITEGYLNQINANFRGVPASDPIGYLGRIPGMVGEALGWSAVPVVLLAVVALMVSGWRSRVLGLAAVAVLGVALLVVTPPPFARYWVPILPGLALAAGVGLTRIPNQIARSLTLVVLASAAAVLLMGVFEDARSQEEVIDEAPFSLLAEHVEGGGVIGVRSHQLAFVSADVRTFGGQFLTEEEYVTYLTWPSDEAVIAMMRKRNIVWALVIPDRILEIDYHQTWIGPAYGRQVRHPESLASSPNFCRELAVDGYLLYRVGPC